MGYISKYRIHLILVSVILLLLSYVVHFYHNRPQELSTAAKDLKKGLFLMERDFERSVADSSDVLAVLKDDFSQDLLDKLVSRPYSILVYQGSDLKFWNNQEVSLPYSSVKTYPQGVSFVDLVGGYYQLIKKEHSFEFTEDRVTVLALQLIQKTYDYENKYLSNELNSRLKLPAGIRLSSHKVHNAYPLSFDDERNELYLSYDDVGKEKSSLFGLLLGFIGLLIWLLLLTEAAISVGRSGSGLAGALFLTVGLIMIRLFMIIFDVPISIGNMALFQPPDEFPYILANSMGNMLINVFMIFWIVFYIHQHVRFPDLELQRNQRMLVLATAIAGFGLCTLGLILSLRHVIVSLDNSVNIGTIIDTSFATAISLLVFHLLLFSYLLICQRTADLLETLHFKWKTKLQILAAVLIPYLLVNLWTGMEVWEWIFVVWCIFFVLASEFFRLLSGKDFTTTRLAIWVASVALFTSFLIADFERHKDEVRLQDYVSNLNLERDPITEFLFEDVSLGISRDNAIRHYYEMPYLPKRELIKRLYIYFGSYFTKYDIKIHPFKLDGESLSKRSDSGLRLQYYEQKINGGYRTESTHLFLFTNPNGGSSYLAKIPVHTDKSPLPVGYVIIEMIKNGQEQRTVYPDLVIEDKYRVPSYYSSYENAIYLDDTLSSSKGDYRYPYVIDPQFKKKRESFSLRKSGYLHIVQNLTGNKSIIASKKAEFFNDLLSILSFVIFSLFVLALLAIVLSGYRQFGSIKMTIRELFYSSLRKKVNFAVILIIFISFLGIGLVTVYNFTARSGEYHAERLTRIQSAIRTAIEYEIKSDRDLNSDSKLMLDEDQLMLTITTISEINHMDVNLYDTDGNLLVSSQPIIFDKGLVSKNMNPVAYFNMNRLNRRNFIQNENIGKLNYLASYSPILNPAGEVLGYLQLPYYAKEQNLKEQISNFLVTLFNVYVLLLIGAAFLALFVSRSITQSLTLISSKLKDIRLDQKNELLEWPDDDEIGALVEQYNEIIIQLDKSAQLLAKTEREYAWQQMAKQVAHEIKNPLTPMKLSIQHLQRAHERNAPNIKELTDRVTGTLIEQIDNLSEIASAFGDFAKMPRAQAERINLREIISRVVVLFRDDKKAKVLEMLPEEDIFVMADKHQLISVFNNIIKNAIQAIPEEREGCVVVNIKRMDEGVIVGISDNGKGIPEEMRDKVFVPNFTTKNSGMGLGLAICKNIINNAGGEIWFQSRMNEGTTFFIKLPLDQPDHLKFKAAAELRAVEHMDEYDFDD